MIKIKTKVLCDICGSVLLETGEPIEKISYTRMEMLIKKHSKNGKDTALFSDINIGDICENCGNKIISLINKMSTNQFKRKLKNRLCDELSK